MLSYWLSRVLNKHKGVLFCRDTFLRCVIFTVFHNYRHISYNDNDNEYVIVIVTNVSIIMKNCENKEFYRCHHNWAAVTPDNERDSTDLTKYAKSSPKGEINDQGPLLTNMV